MIARYSLLKVFLGSFFIQSSWSFEKMQGLGFAAAISPALREIFGPEGLKPALKRHLTLYNSHPYMAGPILGATIRLEEDSEAEDRGGEAAARFKKRVMGAYGAIGDLFFWASLRPLASIIGILTVPFWGVWGSAVFLAVYNAPHLWMRWRGLEQGYRRGTGVVEYIKTLGLPGWGKRARFVISLALGVLAALWAQEVTAPVLQRAAGYPGPGSFAAAVALTVLGAAALGFLIRRGVTVQRLAYVVVLPLVLYGIIVSL